MQIDFCSNQKLWCVNSLGKYLSLHMNIDMISEPQMFFSSKAAVKQRTVETMWNGGGLSQTVNKE